MRMFINRGFGVSCAVVLEELGGVDVFVGAVGCEFAGADPSIDGLCSYLAVFGCLLNGDKGVHWLSV